MLGKSSLLLMAKTNAWSCSLLVGQLLLGRGERGMSNRLTRGILFTLSLQKMGKESGFGGASETDKGRVRS